MVDPRRKSEKAKTGTLGKRDLGINKEELERAAAAMPARMPSKRGESFMRQQGSLLNVGDDVPSLEEMEAVRGNRTRARTVRAMRDEPEPALDNDMVSADDFEALELAAAGFEDNEEDTVRRRNKGSNPFAAKHHAHGDNTPKYNPNGVRNDGFESFYTPAEKAERGVATGPSGKKETGGRRARKAMGMAEEDRYAEINRVEKQASYVNQMKGKGKKASFKK